MIRPAETSREDAVERFRGKQKLGNPGTGENRGTRRVHSRKTSGVWRDEREDGWYEGCLVCKK